MSDTPIDSETVISEEDILLDLPVDPADRNKNNPSGQQAGLTRLDPFQRYMLEIKQFKALSAEEEHDLAIKYQETGDERIAYQIITANLSLVVKIARIYSRAYSNIIDLVQEGNIGLMEAVRRFDPYKGNRLPTYASWWIKAYIIKFVIDNFRIVRIGTTNERRKLLFNLRKEKERLRLQGIEPTIPLLANNLNASEEDVIAVNSNIKSEDLSLDEPVGNSENLHVSDTLQASETPIDDALARGELQALFNRKMEEFSKTLTEREQVILRDRLVAQEPQTLQQIAERFDVTREAIRLNEKTLIKKIKTYMEESLSKVTDVEFGLLR
jgi:RNA polymerase sigma-32 factor